MLMRFAESRFLFNARSVERGESINIDRTGVRLSLAPRQLLATGVPTTMRERGTDRWSGRDR